MKLECKTCDGDIEHHNKRQRTCGDDEFTVVASNYCNNHSARCNICDFQLQYSGLKMPSSFRREMGKHVRTCKHNLLSIDQEAEEILVNTQPGESPSNNIFDTTDHVFDNVDSTGDMITATRQTPSETLVAKVYTAHWSYPGQ